MLPPVALPGLTAVDVLVVVPIEIIVVVNVHVAVVPIAIAPVAAGPRTQRKSGCTPCQPHPGVIPGIGIRVIGICRRRCTINDLWVVRRNVNYIGLSWLDRDHLLAALNCFGLHCLLRAGF
jgi:hypothetical protein